MRRVIRKTGLAVALAAGAVCGGLTIDAAQAGEYRTRGVQQGLSEHPKSGTYRRGPQVRGYVARRGGYSYSAADAAIDYRDTSILRDVQNSRRQGGPFDSGFFYDSGINNKLNDSPYLN